MKYLLLVVGFITLLLSVFKIGKGSGIEYVEKHLNMNIMDVKNSLKECEDSLIYRNESCVVVVKQSGVE